jgi:hypothetical protein
MLSRQLRNAAVAVVALTVLQFVPLKAAVAPALRTAIVVGNGTYPKDQLKNATNDARAMASVLRELGFEVKLAEDLSLEQFRALVRDPTTFAHGSVALFYYAGHAVQFKGINYLLPVDFELRKPEDLPSVSVDLTEVMNDMNGAGVGFSIIILDSCRNYPFGEMAEAFGSGLATVAASGETLVAYSTAAGDVAFDGNGPNSPYTSALVSALEPPGRDIYEVFRTVRAKVREATNGRQLPWITGSVESELVFREPDPQSGSDAGKTDLASVLWRSIEKSRDPTDFTKFLALYSTDNELAPKATARRGELLGAGEPRVVAGRGPDLPAEPGDRPDVALVEQGERVVGEELGEGLAVRDAGDPPAHKPRERPRVAQPHLARGVPERAGVGGRGAAVMGADGRTSDPVVQAFVGSVR